MLKCLILIFYYLNYFISELIERAGEVAVITGGARGIGVEVVKCLLKCDMEVIVGKNSLLLFGPKFVV